MNERYLALKEVLISEYGYEEVIDINELINMLKNEDYLVLSDEEADKVAYDMVSNLIDDMGLKHLNLDLTRYFNEDFFSEYYTEYFEQYIEDLRYSGDLQKEMEYQNAETEEELLSLLLFTAGKYGFVQSFLDEYDDSYIDYLIKNEPSCINMEELIDDIIKIDGRGNIISSYDGYEHEVKIGDNYWYVYRLY